MIIFHPRAGIYDRGISDDLDDARLPKVWDCADGGQTQVVPDNPATETEQVEGWEQANVFRHC